MANQDGRVSVQIDAETYRNLLAIRAVLEAETDRAVSISKAIAAATAGFMGARGITTERVVQANGLDGVVDAMLKSPTTKPRRSKAKP